MKFNLGQTVMTRGIVELNASHDAIIGLLSRHVIGDWGELPDEDWHANDMALASGDRLLSAYDLNGERVWVITDAGRQTTTILLPSEY